MDRRRGADGYMPMRLTSSFRTSARRTPAAPAIISDGAEITYQALLARVNRIANLARDKWSLERGDIVALIAPNRAEYIELVFALSDVGVVVATINPRLSPAEFETIYRDCQPRLALVDPSLPDIADVSSASGVKTITIDEAFEQDVRAAKDDFAPPPFPEEDSFCLCYTSGTTGEPKGVLLSHRSRALTVQAMEIEYGCFGLNSRFLALAPLCHGAGFAFAAAALSFGGACVLFNNNDPSAIAARLGAGDISGVFMVPTHFSRMVQQSPAELQKLRSAHRVRTIISNAAALAPALKHQTAEIFGHGLLNETYGSTEAGIVTNIRPSDILRKPSSVGVPFINTQISVRRPDGAECGVDEIGELFSRGPYTFNGYLNRPAETAEAIVDGWVSVKDLASRDSEGFLTICGRMKDMVVSGGVNIYPAEIEAVIEAYPGIEEVAVVGLPDPEWGERLHAFVVASDGGALDVNAISDLCRRALATYKVPKGFSFLAELPRNVSGKILKRELRESAASGAE